MRFKRCGIFPPPGIRLDLRPEYRGVFLSFFLFSQSYFTAFQPPFFSSSSYDLCGIATSSRLYAAHMCDRLPAYMCSQSVPGRCWPLKALSQPRSTSSESPWYFVPRFAPAHFLRTGCRGTLLRGQRYARVSNCAEMKRRMAGGVYCVLSENKTELGDLWLELKVKILLK